MNPETPHGPSLPLADRTPKAHSTMLAHKQHRADSMPIADLDNGQGPPDTFVRNSSGIQKVPPQKDAWKAMLMHCTNVPKMDILSETDAYVTLTVERNGAVQGG
jgi:hypothetical protein